MIDRPTQNEHIFPRDPRVRTYECFPQVKDLVEAIRADRVGGEPLRQRFRALAQIMGTNWLDEKEHPQPFSTIIGIPRSGIPMAEGLRQIIPFQAMIQANLGLNRNLTAAPLDLGRSDYGNDFVLADSVIFSGRTLLEILECLREQNDAANITIFAALASPEGLERVLRRYPDINFQIAQIEPHTRSYWDHQLYRVVTTMSGVGNFGQLVSR